VAKGNRRPDGTVADLTVVTVAKLTEDELVPSSALEFGRVEAAQKWIKEQPATGPDRVYVLMREIGIMQTTVDTRVKTKLS
jgi:hypothetical protein